MRPRVPGSNAVVADLSFCFAESKSISQHLGFDPTSPWPIEHIPTIGHCYIGPTPTICAISVQKIKRSVGTQSIPECPHISTHTMFARFPYQFAIKHLKLTPRQVWKTWRGLLLFLCFMLAAGEMSPVPQRSHY